jgi:hypothetical protein
MRFGSYEWLVSARRMPGLGALALVVLLGLSPAHAAVSEEEANRLGNELTPIGADPGGNAEGTIPAWEGAAVWTEEQKTYRHADIERMRREDPNQMNWLAKNRPETMEPLYTITAENYQEYAERLSAGHKRLFERYPDTYKMVVYPTVRGSFFPDEIYEATRRNAVTARLEGTDELHNAQLGFPFPIPANGAEAIWNHRLKFRGSGTQRYNNQAVVDADGSYQRTQLIEDVRFEYGNIRADPDDREDNVFAYYMQRTLSPARVAGQIVLVHEIFGAGTSGRNAWIYNPGLARVNRAPEVGFDNPSLGSDGLQFNDQINMFNGSLSRYTWRLVGKREMYIPYNSMEINSARHRYDDIIGRGHVNQDLARYELHRVWVIEAELRPGARHQFKRRTFYLDEDSWVVAMMDAYDNRDQLWKLSEGHVMTAPFIPTTTTLPEIHYDLLSGRYFVTALSNEDRINNFEADFPRSHFSVRNLQRMQRR